jgi:hypothetical protein
MKSNRLNMRKQSASKHCFIYVGSFTEAVSMKPTWQYVTSMTSEAYNGLKIVLMDMTMA